MSEFVPNENQEADEMLGEWHPLVDQLGSTEGLFTLGSASLALRLPKVTDRASLQTFLETYKSRILIPLELPAILRSYLHASRNETRELIAFDQRIGLEPILSEFVRPSQRIGRFQLRRLRPLRDHRLLQRYSQAVAEERAHGWHTVVFGLTLSIYSLPVRQGLVFYERQTLRGFLYAAAAGLRLTHRDCLELLDRLCSDLPHDLEGMSSRGEWTTPPTRRR